MLRDSGEHSWIRMLISFAIGCCLGEAIRLSHDNAIVILLAVANMLTLMLVILWFTDYRAD